MVKIFDEIEVAPSPKDLILKLVDGGRKIVLIAVDAAGNRLPGGGLMVTNKTTRGFAFPYNVNNDFGLSLDPKGSIIPN